MKRLISVPLAAGGSVLLEVEEEAGTAVTRGLHAGEVAEAAGNSFEAAFSAIRPAVLAVANTLRDLPDAPKEIEVEFGVKFSGQAGAFIASASTEAQFRIKMAWKREAAA